MDVQEIQAVVSNVLAFLLLLTTLQPPLDDGTFPLQQRLLLDFLGCTFYGRDVLFSPNIRTGMVVLEKYW